MIIRQHERDCAALPDTERFRYEAVTVNERGEVIERRVLEALRFFEGLPGGVVLEMTVIPAGRILMGSPDRTGYADEHPQHAVRVPSFAIGRYAVTQAQWQAIMPASLPWRCRGAQRPADRVSWLAASDFCKRLSRATGRGYRLPREAEWEMACRAGTSTPFSCGATITTDVANYVGEHTYRSEPKGVYRHGTTEVGSFPPNSYGLCDMHGNVWEWCADAWHDSYTGAPADGAAWRDESATDRVLRGGCWHDPPDLCRSAARLQGKAEEREDFFGFRLALACREPCSE
jgi:formylglycine-generating enzyme required for sulfatase activity